MASVGRVGEVRGQKKKSQMPPGCNRRSRDKESRVRNACNLWELLDHTGGDRELIR